MRCCPKRDNRISYTSEDGAVNPSAAPVSTDPEGKRSARPSAVVIISIVVVVSIFVVGVIVAVCTVLILTPSDSLHPVVNSTEADLLAYIGSDAGISDRTVTTSVPSTSTTSAFSSISPSESPTMAQSLTPRKIHKEMTAHLNHSCLQGEFECSNGECIADHLRCNKIRNCPKGEDEFNCSCVDHLTLLSPHKLCDRINDCLDGSDESNCTSCRSTEFLCSVNNICVAKELQCDGHDDCADGEDETDCIRLVSNLQEIPDWRIRSTGFVAVQRAGVWYPVCIGLPVIVAHNQHPLFDLFCSSSRYKSVGSFNFIAPNSHSPVGFQVVSGSVEPTAFASSLRFEHNCQSGKLLNLSCTDAVCGLTPKCEPRRSRIVGGVNSGNGCAPWAVALYKSGQLSCMAVVLNEEWLITAAHCFSEKLRSQYWTARLGFYRQFSESPYEEVRLIDQVIRHPGYSELPIENNDIALLHLDRPVMFSDHIRPVCLPKAGEQPGPGLTCIVAGWGFKDEDERFPADELQQAGLTVMLKDRCNSSSQFKGLVRPTHLCLSHGAEMKDACQGDSGGPLLCPSRLPNDPAKYYLAGVTSTGYGCARPDLPGIWTSVADFIPWIKEMLNNPVVHSLPVGLNKICYGFRCRLGDCIYNWLKCDGQHDCLVDGSDEKLC